MSIIRVFKQKNFSIISNVALNDTTISMKAKGIWAYLLSKPDDWQVYVSQLIKSCIDGKHSIYAGLKELKQAGYIEHVAIREGGKIIGYEYIVNEEPVRKEKKEPDKEPNTDTNFLLTENLNTENLNTENLNTENLNTENRTLLKTDRIHYSSLQKTDNNKGTTPKPKTEPKIQKPSSSHFEKNEIKELMDLVPKQNLTETLSPQFKAIFLKALIAGHTVAYIALAITYTKDKSKGSPQEFKAYLGKTLDKNYHAGYVSKKEERRINQEKQRQLEADRRERERLKMQQERQEMEKIKAQNMARSKALEALKSLNPTHYREVQCQALEELKSKAPNYKYDIEGNFVKSKMAVILGL
jgi:hypothetical protein